METIHVETKYQGTITLPDELIKELPERVVICSIIQYIDLLNQVEAQLVSAGKQVSKFKSIHGSVQGQILGCDVFKYPGEYDCFLFLGDGLFHPTALLYENQQPVYTYSPTTQLWKVHTQEDLKKVQQKRKAGLMKFYHANKVGILLTIKEGQAPIQSRKIRDIEQQFPDKQFFYFLSDSLDIRQLENYPFIESWVNTACPRIMEDDAALVNLRDILVAQSKSS